MACSIQSKREERPLRREILKGRRHAAEEAEAAREEGGGGCTAPARRSVGGDHVDHVAAQLH